MADMTFFCCGTTQSEEAGEKARIRVPCQYVSFSQHFDSVANVSGVLLSFRKLETYIFHHTSLSPQNLIQINSSLLARSDSSKFFSAFFCVFLRFWITFYASTKGDERSDKGILLAINE